MFLASSVLGVDVGKDRVVVSRWKSQMKRLSIVVSVGTLWATVVVLILYLLNDGEPPKADLSWFEVGVIMWLICVPIAFFLKGGVFGGGTA